MSAIHATDYSARVLGDTKPFGGVSNSPYLALNGLLLFNATCEDPQGWLQEARLLKGFRECLEFRVDLFKMRRFLQEFCQRGRHCQWFSDEWLYD